MDERELPENVVELFPGRGSPGDQGWSPGSASDEADLDRMEASVEELLAQKCLRPATDRELLEVVLQAWFATTNYPILRTSGRSRRSEARDGLTPRPSGSWSSGWFG